MTIDPETKCDACGKFGAVAFAEEALCVDCYAVRGSSCAGSGTQAEPAENGATNPPARKSKF